jgi:hypothetical protein
MLALLLQGTLVSVLIFLIAWVLLMPTKAEKVAGWLWGFLTWAGGGARKKATAYSVQGHINDATKDALRNGPDELIEGPVKIRFHAADHVKAVLEEGRVVVFMRRHQHVSENVAHALMAYLPQAVLSRARRYVDDETIRAADLTLAKTVLSGDSPPKGALDCFYEHHLEPAAGESAAMRQRLEELDEIDLHGWLTRVLLAQYRALGQALYPGAPFRGATLETEAYERWLHRLASLKPSELGSLRFEGKLMRVAVIFVARPEVLDKKGVTPYRSRAKNLIYDLRFDAVYLMARDHNIPAVREIVKTLRGDGRLSEVSLFQYPLRSDFAARRLPRKSAALACIRRRRSPGEVVVPVRTELDDGVDLPDELFEPKLEEAVGEDLAVLEQAQPGANGTATPTQSDP